MLVQQFRQFLVLDQQLAVVLENELDFLLELRHFLAFGAQDGVLFLQAGGADVAGTVWAYRYSLTHFLRL